MNATVGLDLIGLVGLVRLGVVVVTEGRRREAIGLARARVDRPGWVAPTPPSWFGDALAALDLDVDPSRTWPWCVSAAVAAGAALVVRAPIAAMATIALAVSLRPIAQRILRRDRSWDVELIAAVDAMAAALRSGASLRQAVDRAGTPGGLIGPGLRLAAVRSRGGMPLDGALAAWARDAPAEGAALVVDALAMAGLVGAGQADALDAVARTLRERQAQAREQRALTSQARASAVVLVCAPVGFSIAVAVADPRVAHTLLATPGGWACVMGGVVFDAAGAWWMAALVRRAT